MKSADRFPLKLAGCDAAAIPPGVPIADAVIIITQIALASSSAANVLPRELEAVR